MAREYFCAYHSYLKAMEQLNDAERGRLFTGLLQYSISGVEPELRGNERFLFSLIQQQIDRDKEKYEKKCATNRANGSLGGKANASERYRTQANATERPPNAPQDKDKDKDKDKGKGKDECNCLPGVEATPGRMQENNCPNFVLSIPLNDGTEFPISAQNVQEWENLYPAVDVMAALRKMRGWCLANPKNRKTQRGIMRFINGWLARDQDNAPRKEQANGSHSGRDEKTSDEYGLCL